MARPLPVVGLLLVCALGAGACGGNDAGDAPGSERSPNATSSGDATDSASSCRTDLEATYPDGSTVALTASAAAVSLGDGAAYTLYVGDYDIPTDDVTTATVIPPKGRHQATVFLTVYNAATVPPPIEAGATADVGASEGELALGAILYAGTQDHSQAVDATGSATVTAVDDTSLCVDVDYTDEQKQLHGTIAAPVYDSGY